MNVQSAHRMEENMKNKIKTLIATCLGCILLLGGAMTVWAAGTLSIAVSSGTVATGDTMTITVYAVDANNAEVTADMNITYDASKLEYVSSSAGTGGGGSVKASGSTVTVKFKAISSGDAYVKAEGATLTAAGTHINVSGTATKTENEDATDDTANTVKSGDNSLSSLKISPGTLSPEFKGNTTQYTATVGSDVNEITVTPVTSNSKATVESITGNTNLKAGTNVITVLVKAENGTEAAYKITVTKSDTTTTTTDDATTTDTTDTAEKDSEATVTTDAQTQGSSDAIVIDGVNYKISDDFTDAEIPEGFTRADFEYKGESHKALSFEYGHLGLYYLVNEAGEGKFFVYDAYRDRFYPYVRLTCGEHYIILMGVPNGAIPPEDYEETTLTLPDSTVIQAYQYAGVTDQEIVNFDSSESVEGTETVANAGARSDFYVLYGIDGTGVSGWYQYDVTQGTYQRLNGEIMRSSSENDNYDSLLQSYNELNDRYKDTKTKDRRLIAVLIFVAVVLVIVIINMFLKFRDTDDDDDDDWEEKKPVRKAKTSVPKKEINKKNEAKREPEVRMPKREEKRLDSFYEDDDVDTMDEFEDDPGMLSRKTKKRERTGKTQRVETVAREPEKTGRKAKDDDIEFLDLNDL